MAVKEKALKRIDDKFKKNHIPYVVFGDWPLNLQGLVDTYHDFWILVPFSFASDAEHILQKLGMGKREKEGPDFIQGHYHFDGADITLFAGLPLQSPYKLALDENRTWRTVGIPGCEVPVMELEDMLLIAYCTGDEKAYTRLASIMEKADHVHPDQRSHAIIQPVPQEILEK